MPTCTVGIELSISHNMGVAFYKNDVIKWNVILYSRHGDYCGEYKIMFLGLLVKSTSTSSMSKSDKR